MGVHLSKNDRVLALIATMALASLAVGGVVFVVTDGDARVTSAATSRQAATHASEAAIALALSDQEGALDDTCCQAVRPPTSDTSMRAPAWTRNLRDRARLRSGTRRSSPRWTR